MAPVPIVWSDEALADLTEIHGYIARHSACYALIVVERLPEAMEQVVSLSASGRMVPGVADPAVREVIHGAYRIDYELRQGRAEVLAVFRGTRLFPRDVQRAK
jgi:plasmid stabilization system protein ParE